MSRFPHGTVIAARLFYLRPNDAAKNSRELPAHAATHFWDPSRGGGSVIVATDGTYLFADSAVSWDRHLGDFVAGHRSAFGATRMAPA